MATITPITVQGTSGQSGFFNRYPYTDFHQLNLDFLLTSYQSIIDKVNETISWANNHQIEYEEAIERLTAVEGEIDNFEAQVRAAFAEQKAQIDADFAAQRAEMEAALAQTEEEVAEQIRLLTNEVNAAIASIDTKFDALESRIIRELNTAKLQINEALAELNQRLLDNNVFVFEYVENRLDQFIEDFPNLVGIQVYNPFRGEMTQLQVAINDLYDMACVYGLTALQFDTLDKTVSEFEAYDMTVREFDQFGCQIMGYPDPIYYMYDPFTGEMSLVKTVVEKLAALHTDAESVSATEFDTLDMEAQQFDATDITAFNFDWYSKTILI